MFNTQPIEHCAQSLTPTKVPSVSSSQPVIPRISDLLANQMKLMVCALHNFWIHTTYLFFWLSMMCRKSLGRSSRVISRIGISSLKIFRVLRYLLHVKKCLLHLFSLRQVGVKNESCPSHGTNLQETCCWRTVFLLSFLTTFLYMDSCLSFGTPFDGYIVFCKWWQH